MKLRLSIVILSTLAIVSCSVAQADEHPSAGSSPHIEAQSVLYHEPDWSPLTITGRTGHAVTYDSRRGRMVVFGGDTREGLTNDTHALSLGAGGRWFALPQVRGEFRPRKEASLTYDSHRDQYVVFGGLAIGPMHPFPGVWCVPLNDVWVLKPDSVRPLEPVDILGPRPPGRWAHSSFYDPLRERILVMGGRRFSGAGLFCGPDTLLSDIWEFTPGRDTGWRELSHEGEMPPPGLLGSATVDSTGDRVLLTSGATTWAMSLAEPHQWRRLGSTGSLPLGPGPTVLDGDTRRLIAQRETRTWVATLDDTLEWSEASTSNTHALGPGFSAIWDSGSSSLVLFGGTATCGPSAETWSLSFDTDPPSWTLAQALPPRLVGHGTIYDPERDRIIAIGGSQNSTVYEFDLAIPGAWRPLEVSGEGPGPSFAPATVYVPGLDGVVVFGGSSDPTTRLLRLATTPASWVRMHETSPVSSWLGVAAAYDPIRRRVLATGGDTLSSDVWELRLEDPRGWFKLEVEGTAPAPRAYASATFDPISNRFVLFGGWNANGGSRELWALDLETNPRWQLVDPATPLTSSDARLVYDPVRERLILHGSAGYGSETYVSTSTAPVYWDFVGRRCCPGETFGPWGSNFPSISYDGARDALVVTGGALETFCNPRPWAGVWSLEWGVPLRTIDVDLAPGERRNRLVLGRGDLSSVVLFGVEGLDLSTISPTSLSIAGAPVLWENHSPRWRVVDWNRDGYSDLEVLFAVDETHLAPGDTLVRISGTAGQQFTVRGSDHVQVVAYETSEPAPPQAEDPPGFRIEGWRRGYSGRGLIVFAELPEARSTRVELLDVTGRRISLGRFTPSSNGRHEFPVADDRSLRPGIYWVRIAQDRQTIARKIALVP